MGDDTLFQSGRTTVSIFIFASHSQLSLALCKDTWGMEVGLGSCERFPELPTTCTSALAVMLQAVRLQDLPRVSPCYASSTLPET